MLPEEFRDEFTRAVKQGNIEEAHQIMLMYNPKEDLFLYGRYEPNNTTMGYERNGTTGDFVYTGSSKDILLAIANDLSTLYGNDIQEVVVDVLEKEKIGSGKTGLIWVALIGFGAWAFLG